MVTNGRPAGGLDRILSKSLAQRKTQSTIRQLTTFPAHAIDFSSNDFLSLASSPELYQDFLRELQSPQSNPQQLGSGGSRLLDGNSIYAERLEREIAGFHHAPSGLLCNSGFDANVGLFSCLPQPGDVVLYDELIHASVHDGMRSSRASKCLPFAHNDLAALQTRIEQCRQTHPEITTGRANVFVAVETVYSMDGDVAPLAEMVQLKNRLFPRGNAYLIVDEAHSTGVFGAHGRGLVCELGLESEITVRLHTFGKALACNGAILLCNETIRQYLINYARPLIYTTFMSYPSLAAITAVYGFLMRGRTEGLARHLQVLISALHERLLELRADLRTMHGSETLLSVSSLRPRTPIFSLQTSEPKLLAAFCQRRGMVLRAIVPPTVPAGSERVRVCLHAGNTIEHIDLLVSTVREWVVRRIREVETETTIRARL